MGREVQSGTFVDGDSSVPLRNRPVRIRAMVMGLLVLLGWAANIAVGAETKHIAVILAPDDALPLEQGLLQGLSELGYRDGQNLHIEKYRESYGPGLKPFSKSLENRNIDVVVTFSTPHARAILDGTQFPVVFLSGDPIRAGLAASLAKPGGRGTGISNMVVELTAKRMEILHEFVPKAKRVGVLFNKSNSSGIAQSDEARKAAGAMGLRVVMLGASNAEELFHTLNSMNRKNIDAVMVTGDLLMLGNRAKIASTLHKAKIPAIYASPIFHDAGVLVTYGGDMKEAARKLAIYVDRILRGTKPEDLPVEQLSKYELIINERIAKEIGVPIPQTLLMRANELIK